MKDDDVEMKLVEEVGLGDDAGPAAGAPGPSSATNDDGGAPPPPNEPGFDDVNDQQFRGLPRMSEFPEPELPPGTPAEVFEAIKQELKEIAPLVERLLNDEQVLEEGKSFEDAIKGKPMWTGHHIPRWVMDLRRQGTYF